MPEGRLDKIEVLSDEDVAETKVAGSPRGPWWDLMEQLHSVPGKWCVIAKWATEQDNDESRARWLRTRFIQKKAGKIPAGLYNLKSKQLAVDGFVIGSQLFAMFVEPRPDGIVEFVPGERGRSSL